MASPTRKSVVLVALTGGAFLAGVWAIYPVFKQALDTTPLQETAGVWVGTVLGVAWFIRFVVWHFVLSNPLRDEPVSEAAHARHMLKILVLSVALAQLIEVGSCRRLLNAEHSAFDNGLRQYGQIVATRHSPGHSYDHYWIRYRYSDSAGVSHENTYQFSIVTATGQPEREEDPSHTRNRQPWCPEMYAALMPVQAWGKGKGNIDWTPASGYPPLPIRVDRSFPARAWVEQDDWWNARVNFTGPAILMIGAQTLLQLSLLPGFSMVLYRKIRSGHVPWWKDMHHLVPLGICACTLLLWGLSVRLFTRQG